MSDSGQIKGETRHVVKENFYGNTLLLSATSQPLVAISDKKKNWYLKRDLAEDVTAEFHSQEKFKQHDLILRLKFKSKIEMQNNAFYFQPLVTRCVVCGKEENLSVHHVIPQVVRQHFEEKEKSHAHSWCVLLCEDHHREADKLALTIHESSLKDLDRKVKEETKRMRREWALKLIAENGGLGGIKSLYRSQFLQTNPQYLPEGFLQDHKSTFSENE